MNRSLLIQFSILFLIIIILFFSYNYLLDANRDKKVADAGQESGNKEINLSKNSDLEVIEELSYISSDEKGNTYKILSDSGKINEEDPDILLLKNVFAEITLKNSGKIFIYSDQAKYNKSNLNTHFFENVELNYEDHNIKSENIFLDYVTKEVKIAENVVYNDSNNKLNADAIDMDLITKFSKIYMINKDNKITATIKN
tara:strand:+ start:1432 stop:2028 length:597 start_codon:yes stop_codon:yes gene_type:complete